MINDNPNSFTGGGDFYTNDIGKEQDILRGLGLPFTTSDNVDLQYFLAQYKYSNSVNRVTGYGAAVAVELYIAIGSGVSAVDNGVGWPGYKQDVSADIAGNREGYYAGISGLEEYIKENCSEEDECGGSNK